MRIISGKYKGRNLVSFKADHIRPTMDRIKETIFNKWMMYVDGAKVLDLFAGTGNLGIEALSRGATHVTFVEKSNKSMNIVKENLELLKISKSDYQIQLKDVLAFIRQDSNTVYDLIFIDPPFTEKMAHDVMNAMGKSSIFGPHTRIVIESIKQERIDDTYGDLVCYDRQDHGDKFLSFFAKPE